MAHASSRARTAYKQNTAVLYVDPEEVTRETPVSTARVVPVGAANAARSGGTLQLVGGVMEADGRQMPVDVATQEPQVVEVEPPRAAPRGRVHKRSTRVIAYNVRIVAQDEQDEQTADEPSYDERVDHRQPLPDLREQPFQMPPQRSRSHADDTQYMEPMRGQRASQNAQFEVPPPRAHYAMPEQQASYAMPRNPQRGPMAGSIPMSLFGALENMGGRLHEQSRRAAAAAADGSYKQILAQHLNAGRGPLLSNRNMCIAVGAYALILFLLAVFSG